MPDLYNVEGIVVGDITLPSEIFEVTINYPVLHQVIVNILANKRQGTKGTKTRTEVRGGGAKPWRQKGTGRARQGSTRAPQWRGGGVVHAPLMRDYGYKINKKLKKIALSSALSARNQENALVFLEDFDMQDYSTKYIKNILKNIKVPKALLVLANNDKIIVKSSQNLATLGVTHVGQMNVYDILNYKTCVMTKKAVTKLREVYCHD